MSLYCTQSAPNGSLLPMGLIKGWRLAHWVRWSHCYDSPRQNAGARPQSGIGLLSGTCYRRWVTLVGASYKLAKRLDDLIR
jgi:hypothetical protein